MTNEEREEKIIHQLGTIEHCLLRIRQIRKINKEDSSIFNLISIIIYEAKNAKALMLGLEGYNSYKLETEE